MIKGIGIDMIELSRIRHILQQKRRFADRILAQTEKTTLDALPTDRRQIEYLAGRFAAKEALSKAAGRGIGQLSFQDINVTNNTDGAPVMEAVGFEDRNIFISIAHSQDYAIAQVILEDRN